MMNPVYVSLIGQVLLWCGFLGGALAAVWRLEDTTHPWQTIPWPMYLASAAMGLVGVMLIRYARSMQRRVSVSSAGKLEAAAASLKHAHEKVATLANQLHQMTCEQVLEYIDNECAPHLADFADNRMVISNRYGTAVYATVMTEFASGERYLNRTWSAAADGYVDEVVSAAGHAAEFLKAAVASLKSVNPHPR